MDHQRIAACGTFDCNGLIPSGKGALRVFAASVERLTLACLPLNDVPFAPGLWTMHSGGQRLGVFTFRET